MKISETVNNTISEIDWIPQFVWTTPSSACLSGSDSGPSSWHSQGIYYINYNEDSQQLSIVLLPLQTAEAAHRGLVINLTSLRLRTLSLLVYSVEKRQQHANRRSVSNVELTLLVGLHLKRLEWKTLYNRVKAQFPKDCKDVEFEFVKVTHH